MVGWFSLKLFCFPKLLLLFLFFFGFYDVVFCDGMGIGYNLKAF